MRALHEGEIALAIVSCLQSTSTRALELVHSEICGPLSHVFLGSSLYITTFIDDYTQKIWVFGLKSKTQGKVLDVFQEFLASIENQSKEKLL